MQWIQILSGDHLYLLAAGAEAYAEVDVETELDALEPSDAVREAFERRRSGKAGAPE